MPLSPLYNIFWQTLTTRHAHLSSGTARIRRYARGYTPLIGFADPARPSLEQLRPYCEPNEQFYCEDWEGTPPPGWCIHAEKQMVKMVWRRQAPAGEDLPQALRLGPVHAEQALALATLTRPGPFGLRTLELGEYYGCFEAGRLIAMAGERLQAGVLREISGVCTHPEHRGAGLGRQLTAMLLRRQLARGEIPFLHVMTDNPVARALYASMGFEEFRTSLVRVISPR